MSDDLNSSGQGSADVTPPPPPPPPPAHTPRRRVIGRKGASIAVASGLVIGGVAGGYAISQAASPTPSAAAPSSGSSVAPPEGRPPLGAGSPASRTEDEQQAATALGITAAQLQTDRAAGKTIAAIAKERNVDVATVIATLVGDENAEIDAAVKAGTVTSAQATQIKAQTTQRVNDMVNGTGPVHGPGGPGAQGEDQQVIATTIGITSMQLQTELTAGKTVAAIAANHGKTSADVISALVASENAEIDQRAASGQITAAQAAQDKTRTQQRVTDLVNGTRPAGGGWGPPGGAPAGAPGTPPTS
ncbi:MAG: hypothetical protein M3019_03760 [Candidatus Dormibacteraeota bacterium]|nr:hypothetical protein [Candidatus Dormibacteraeota bacterium]